MQESNLSKQPSKASKTSNEPSFISKTKWMDETFCKGGCDEIERLDKLCLACQIEYQDYMKEKC